MEINTYKHTIFLYTDRENKKLELSLVFLDVMLSIDTKMFKILGCMLLVISTCIWKNLFYGSVRQ